VHGWKDYLNGDPTPAHHALKEANGNNTDEFMNFSRNMIIDGKLVTGRDENGGLENIGRLDPARYQTQISQLEELGILKQGKVTVERVMTTEFLP
jgi:NitT/TauT family transport system substrate-binding protein